MARGKKEAKGRTQPKATVGTVRRPTGVQTEAYGHKGKEGLLRPDVGLQAQFKQKRPPKIYRYDPSLDPTLSWDEGNPARERAEALIRLRQEATSLDEAKTAADSLARMSSPFLNWTGKAERSEFDVPTLPLFVHERLSTQAILQTLKGHKRDKQQNLFADVDLDITDRILKAYVHKAPWVNRMILGDSLVVMNSLLQYEGLGGQVQMIYMDPPYGVKFGSNFQPFVRKRDVKHGDDSDLTREPEMVQAYRDTWELGLHSYLTYLRDRLLLHRELLHPSGSIFVQISDENLHHVRELLDEVFGTQNLCGIITFTKTSGQTNTLVPIVADFLLWYAKDRERAKFHRLYERKTLGGEGAAEYFNLELSNGEIRRLTGEEIANPSLLPPGSKVFSTDSIVSEGFSGENSSDITLKHNGRKYVLSCSPKSHWKVGVEGTKRLWEVGRLLRREGLRIYKRYFDDFPYMPLTSVWTDTRGETDMSYVVQTAPKVIQRCLRMTTDPGDLVLDPTCGSGTTAYVAEQWGRRWITIDTSRVPLALARQRVLTATFDYYELRDPEKGPAGGFVYKRKKNQKGEEVGGIVPHVTLKSIAQNEPPAEEVLVDRPEVVSGITRVSGAFVVEATIPTPVELEPSQKVQEPGIEYSADPITRMIEILKRSPVLRLPNNQTVTFQKVRRPARAMDLHAEAVVTNGAEQPVAFYIGPEHGPVTEQMVFAAAREAYAKSFSALYVIGFAVQPGASKLIQNCERVVGIPATYVQATMDVQMGDLLKTTRASQVFSVTGAPEVRLTRLKPKKAEEALYQVELLGLDVFDPVTMEAHHEKGDNVPAWFLDTDYNELAFCVSQAFFPRTSAWDSLKRALKGAYEDSVWDHLAGTVSETFTAGEHNRIAVKVIDDRGNELIVVKPLDEAVNGR
jgi:adenine-specific DNA-methyltransferase